MIYLQKNNHSFRQWFKFPPVIVLLIGALAFALLFFSPSFSNRVGVFFAKPILITRSFVLNQTAFLTNFMRPKASLVEENNNLKDEVRGLRADLLFYDALAVEHQRLLQSFGRGEGLPRKIAVVVVKPPQSPYDTIILDIGSVDGIAVDQSIFGSGNTALGRISSVEKNHSTATLFSNSGMESQAIVERSGMSIVVKGNGGGGFEARVPQDSDISLEDIIVLPGRIPAPLGRVVKIDSTPASSFKAISISSLANINYTRWVEVEIN